jgi:DNA modification methylase
MYIGDGEIQTCVTSPPYFGLRDYGTAGQIGLEATPDEYVAKMVEVFREVHRALRSDGTVWLNLGDSYAGSGRGGDSGSSTLSWSTESQGKSIVDNTAREAAVTKRAGESRIPRGSVLPAGLHESVRLAGNIGRAWVPSPAGFKQKDLLGIPWMVAFALRADGWYLRQDIIWHKPNPMPESITDRCTKSHEYIFLLAKSRRYYFDHDAIKEPAIYAGKNVKTDNRRDEHLGETRRGFKRAEGVTVGEKRHKRDVWTVNVRPFKGAHFATFPPDLIEPCILAGSRPGDTVLDPFGGAGTTALVANRLGRPSILCELNQEYIYLAERRLANQS